MKKVIISLSMAALLASCAGNPEGEKAKTTDAVSTTTTTTVAGETLKVDTAASKVEWLGTKITGKHNGTIKIQSGELTFENNVLKAGTFVIDMNTINATDLAADAEMKGKLEGHLKADDFFATQKFPTAKFETTEVKDLGNGKVNVSGNLTIKDVTKNITFDATVVENGADKKTFNADFNINRKDWGVVYAGMKDDAISDEINFKINLVSVK